MGEQLRVVIATTNRHKVEEFRTLLSDVPCTLVSLSDIGIADEVLETGTTFAENAILKAVAYAEMTGLPALADDSGLEIDALGGEPGIYSARWAGADTSYHDRFRLLFQRLDGVPMAERAAHYRCVIALAEPAPRGLYTVVEGALDGQIAHEACGSGGFGYDPIFYVAELGRTVGELRAEEKHRISHRGRAVAALRQPLMRLLAERAERL